MISKFIDEEVANEIISIILYMRKENYKGDISIYFNVPGALLRPSLSPLCTATAPEEYDTRPSCARRTYRTVKRTTRADARRTGAERRDREFSPSCCWESTYGARGARHKRTRAGVDGWTRAAADALPCWQTTYAIQYLL